MKYPATVSSSGSAGSGSSGITVGTTTITSGTNTRVLFDDAGTVGESAGLTYTKATGLLAATILQGGVGSKVGLATSTGFGTLGGVIAKAAPNTTTTGTIEEILATITFPANSVVAGNVIKTRLKAKHAANTNSVTLRIRLGGIAGGTVAVITTSVNAGIIQSYLVDINIVSTTSQVACSALAVATDGGSFSAANSFMALLSANFGSPVDLVITGTTPTSAGDVTLDFYNVEVLQ